MSKVKTQTIRCHKGTLLLYMRAKHGLKCFLKQMRRAVVLADIFAVNFIYLKCHSVADFHHAFCQISDVADLSAEQMDRIFYYKASCLAYNLTLVTILTAHRCVKRSPVYDNGTAHTLGQCLSQLGLGCQYGNLRVTGQAVVADKFRSHRCRDLIIYSRICAHVVRYRSCTAGSLTLLFHA